MIQVETIPELLQEPRRIHMLGIGGIGMAGLAFLLKERGHTVTGSDAQENRQTDWLRGKGITIQNDIPSDVDWIIRSRAVPDSHPDVLAASVPVSWRGEVLPELLRDRYTIAVSGTHGKTTTTAMIAQILNCGYCIGGEVDGFDGTARDGEIMVVEADESDGTVANYHADIAVITNIEYDHMEHHDDFESFEACFRKFIAQTKEKIIYCAEDPVATRLCSQNEKSVPYGLEPIVGQASLYSKSLCSSSGQPSTRSRIRDSTSGREASLVRGNARRKWQPCSTRDLNFNVSLPGRHNQLNAMAALEVCRHLECPDAVSFQTLENLKPIKRRFEKVFEGEYTVISDYAHHPTEIRALINTALETFKPKRLLGVFQPHRYTRTKALGPELAAAFMGSCPAKPGGRSGVEKLWLLPVYAASEQPIEGGTTADLLNRFSNDWKNRIKFFQTLEKTWRDVQCELRGGDVLLIIGAGDIEQMAERFRK